MNLVVAVKNFHVFCHILKTYHNVCLGEDVQCICLLWYFFRELRQACDEEKRTGKMTLQKLEK